MNSSVLTALRRLQKADQQRQSAKEELLAVWEQLAQRDEEKAQQTWDAVEAAYLTGDMATIIALTERLRQG